MPVNKSTPDPISIQSFRGRIQIQSDHEDGWIEWYRLTPQERWEESKKIWQELEKERAAETVADQLYWQPLKQELEALRISIRKSE